MRSCQRRPGNGLSKQGWQAPLQTRLYRKHNITMILFYTHTITCKPANKCFEHKVLFNWIFDCTHTYYVSTLLIMLQIGAQKGAITAHTSTWPQWCIVYETALPFRKRRLNHYGVLLYYGVLRRLVISIFSSTCHYTTSFDWHTVSDKRNIEYMSWCL